MACPTNCCRSGAQQVTAISPPSAACHPRSIPTTPAMNSDSDARDSAGETRANRSRVAVEAERPSGARSTNWTLNGMIHSCLPRAHALQ